MKRARCHFFVFSIVLILSLQAFPVFAAGGKEVVPPLIDLKKPEREYTSPKNADGVKDTLELNFAVTADTKMVIKSYQFNVYDKAGTLVYSKMEKDERRQGFFDRLFGNKRNIGLTMPSSLTWDGKDNEGNFVPDGDYIYELIVFDDQGNVGKTAPLKLTVDNTPPAITELSTPYFVFAPGGEGTRTTLKMAQKGSVENLWEGSFKDAEGKEVASFSWKDGPPEAFSWDGKDQAGNLLPDGKYSYELKGTDLAGNTVLKKFEKDITINTKAAVITLASDLSAFSPKNVKKPALTFTPSVTLEEGIVNWTLSVRNAADLEVRLIKGLGKPPQTIVFNGLDNKSKLLPDGSYAALFSIQYENGEIQESRPLDFLIDTIPPAAVVAVEPKFFSPDGDGIKDTVEITVQTSSEEAWNGIVQSDSGARWEYKDLPGQLDDVYTWDGVDEYGNIVPDGVYTAQLFTTDKAGNYGESKPLQVTVDTAFGTAELKVSEPYFSPNKDGKKETVRIVTNVTKTDRVESATLTVRDSDGTPVRSVQQDRVPQVFEWDGLSTIKRVVPDGTYTVVLDVLYRSGHLVSAAPVTVYVDTMYPAIALKADDLLFSPDGDGVKDTITIRQESSFEDLWEGIGLNAKGEIIGRISWKGNAVDFVWDGKDSTGKVVPDGTYIYRVSATDRAGNTVTADLKGIRLATKVAPVSVVTLDNAFSPNGDGYKDEARFDLTVTQTEGVKAWKFAIIEADNIPVKVFSGDSRTPVPRRITWDGKTTEGRVIDGKYSAMLTVEYENGGISEGRTEKPVLLDISPPKSIISITPERFSPDDDGVNDEVRVLLDVMDESPIVNWTLQILDSRGRLFKDFSGYGEPPKEGFTWNGISIRGEQVESAEDYSLVFTVVDDLRNSISEKAVIPVDILVIKVGDKLKIRISNIQFEANTADFIFFDTEKAQKNLKTVRKLAEILNKYPSHRIEIEGHAVIVYWDNPKKAKIEQEEVLIPLSRNRAFEVKKALIILGVDEKRMTVTGLGGSVPLVPHGDLENRWINRRVEFFLLKDTY
ncbi:MAG: FlgD immunoglobulin-like domain containing protein [Spirochaetota bacterium]